LQARHQASTIWMSVFVIEGVLMTITVPD